MKQTCPDRNGPGPWDKRPNLDRWETNRWSRHGIPAWRLWLEEVWTKIKSRGRRTLSISRDMDKWKSPLRPPRSCSFCGGIHPEDALYLLENGWEVEGTGKSYKRYLEPPGYHENIRRCIDEIRSRSEKLPPFWDPTPPVKLYTSHFTDEQVERFNEVLKRQKAGKASGVGN